jgi:hypothetical protein
LPVRGPGDADSQKQRAQCGQTSNEAGKRQRTLWPLDFVSQSFPGLPHMGLLPLSWAATN